MGSKFITREQITISSSAKNLDADGAGTLFTTANQLIINSADIDVQDDDVYVTFDGTTTPSATAGERWYRGQKYRIEGMFNLLNVQFIRVTGDAVLEVSYWGEAGKGREVQSGGRSDVTLLAGTAAIGKVSHDKSGIGHGVMTVTTAGTDLVLAASTVAKVLIIQAQTDNTGVIAIGASGVDATVATGTGIALYAGDSVVLEIDNLADIFVDATVSGEGVRYTYLT